MSFKSRRARESIKNLTLLSAGAGEGASRRRCPMCWVGHCKVHPLQDHGKSRAALFNKSSSSSTEILDKIYKEQVTNRLNQMLLAAENQKAEAATYRSDMERKRKKANSKKRKNVDMTQLIGARPVSSGSDTEEEDTHKKKRKRKSRKKKSKKGDRSKRSNSDPSTENASDTEDSSENPKKNKSRQSKKKNRKREKKRKKKHHKKKSKKSSKRRSSSGDSTEGSATD